MQYKLLKNLQPITLDPDRYWALRVLIRTLWPEANPANICSLVARPTQASSSNPLGRPLELTAVELVEVDESELSDVLASGESPTIYGMREEDE